MNRKFSGIALFFIIIIIMSFSACSTPVQLNTPQNITLDGNLLTWDAVENATNYIIRINNQDYTANENEYRIIVSEKGQYDIRIMALGDDKDFTDSEFSEYITYIYAGGGFNDDPIELLPRLSAPSNVSIIEGQLTWDLIGFATGYKVEIIAPNNSKTYSNVSAPPFNVVGDVDGVYTLRVMAKANSATHRDSIYSTSVNYEIQDGSFAEVILRAPVQLSYDNGTLSWSRVNNAAGYVINIDDVDSYTLTGGSSNYYDLEFETVKVRQVKVKALGDGALYADSSYSAIMTFPLNTSSPPTNISISGGRLLWSDMPEASGYTVRINSQEIRDIEETEYSLEQLNDGIYSISIKAQGDFVYYKDSPYSREFSYKMADGQPVKLQLPAPENLTMDFNVLIWDEVLLAQEYLITIDSGGEQPEQIITDSPRLSLAGRPDGIYSIHVQAIGDDVIYQDSPLSEQYIHIIGDYSGPMILKAPQNVSVTGKTEFNELVISWSPVSNASFYQVIINNEDEIIINETNETSLNINEHGVHSIKIRAVGDDLNYATSPFTQEYIFEMPTRLETPEDLYIVGDKLSWNFSDFATRYQIEIKGNEYYSYDTTIHDHYTLELEDDGTYYIRVRAMGDSNVFIDSLFTQEVVYILADGGLGGIDNPYLIESVEDLDLIRNYPSAYFRLLANLDLEGIEFDPICDYNSPFSGHFSGNGFTISNLSISGDNTYSGFFGYINGGRIENLNIDNVTLQINNYIEPVGDEEVIISSYAGALYGYANNISVNEVSITNVVISVISNNTYLGLLGGYSTGSIENVTVDGSITSDADVNNHIGGLTGYMDGSIKSVVIGNIDIVDIDIINSSNLYLGGLAGEIYGFEAIDIVVDVDISVVGNISAYIGGLAGFVDNDNIENIDINATIVSSSNENAKIGGLAGQIYSNLYNIIIVADINSNADNNIFIGGLAGEAEAPLDLFDISSQIISEASNAYIAGIFGRGFSNISNGEVNSSMVIAIDGIIYNGGLAGDLTGDVSELVSVADVEISGNIDNVYAGGVSGLLKGDITNCEIDYSNVINDTTSAVFIGGAVGRYDEGTISNLTINEVNLIFESQGDVYAGGAVGRQIQGSIDTINVINAIIAANAKELISIGGIIGESRGDINNVSVVFDINALSSGNNIFAGGIAGISNGIIYDSIANGSLSAIGAGAYVGGIAGISSSLTNVEFNGKIDTNIIEYTGESQYDPDLPIEFEDNFSDLYSGGIVGYLTGNILKATAKVDSIYGKSDYGNAYVGGIVGNYSNSGEARELSVEGVGDNTIQVASNYDAYIGGIAGKSSGIFNVYYDEDREQDIIPAFVSADIAISGISEKDIYAGGFAGLMSSNVNGIDIRANVEAQSNDGNSYVGAIAGYMLSATIIDVDTSADIISTSNIYKSYVGGIAGYMDNSNIERAISKANITGYGVTVYIGGIAGYQDGSISYTYSMDNEYTFNNLENSTLYMGGISGYMQNGSLLNSYSVFELRAETSNNNADIGGIAGLVNSGNISNLYSVVDIALSAISNMDSIGGFVGYNNANISNSYVTGSLVIDNLDETSAMVGDFAGRNESALNNVVSDKLMRATNSLIGLGTSEGIAQETMSVNCTQEGYAGWSNEIWLFRDNYYPRLLGLDSQIDTTSVDISQQSIILSPDSESFDLRSLIEFTYGENTIFKNAYFEAEANQYISITQYGVVDLFYNTPQEESIRVDIYFEGQIVELSVNITAENVITISGQGTEADPYIIDNVKLMKYLSFNVNSYFRLNVDIDMTDIIWTPAGTLERPFSGVLDGNNKKIIGLNTDDNYQLGGLFGYTDGATIKDLILDSINIDNNVSSGDYVVGALAANAYNTTIESIVLRGIINVGADNGALTVGSLIGYADNVIINSVESSVDINSQLYQYSNYIGGLVARLMNNSSVQNSLYKADVNINVSGGGLYYGGLFGLTDSSNVNTSYGAANTSIDANYLNTVYVGGLAGRIDEGSVQDAYSASQIIIEAISISTLNVGGFIGRNTAQVSRCYTLTNINISSVAEFIGFNNGVLQDSYFVSRTDYTSTGVGNNNKTSGLNYIDSADLLSGESITSWEVWNFALGYFPRLKDLNYQDEVTTIEIDSVVEILSPSPIINLLDYIQFFLNNDAIFQGVSIISYDTSVLAILRGGFALVMGDGEVDIDLIFDGGIVKRITVTIEGSEETLFAGGSGTELDPFIILTTNHFNNIRQFRNSYFKLGNSLDFIGVNWESIGTSSDSFTGSFDGDNYSIENIEGESIFGSLYGATIKNLHINNAIISIPDVSYAGVIAREMSLSTINNVHIDSLSSLSTTAQYTGGFVGSMSNNSYIIGSSSLMPIGGLYSNDRYIGGLAGRANLSYIDNAIYNVINTLETSANQLYFGGLVGTAKDLTIENSISSLEIIVNSIENNLTLGGLIAISEDSSIINNQFDVSITINNDLINEANLIIGGLIAQSTRDNITVGSYAISIDVLSADTIDIGGLISSGNSSVVEDITVDIAIDVIADNIQSGGIVASGDSSIRLIEGIIVLYIETKSTTDTLIGGIVAENSGSISDISNMNITIDVTSQSENTLVGGIIGYQSQNSISDILTTTINIIIDASSNIIAGGVTGSVEYQNALSGLDISTIINVNNTSVTEQEKDIIIGGIAGYTGNAITITDSVIDTTINHIDAGRSNWIGGLAGKLNNIEITLSEYITTINYSDDLSKFDSFDTYIGGLVSEANVTNTDIAINTVDYTANINLETLDSITVGGVVADTSATIAIDNSEINSVVTADANQATIGGIIPNGDVDISVSNMNITLDINTLESIETGAIGNNITGVIDNIEAILDITLESTNGIIAGGLIAANEATISSSSIIGRISAKGLSKEMIIGGVVGENNSQVMGITTDIEVIAEIIVEELATVDDAVHNMYVAGFIAINNNNISNINVSGLVQMNYIVAGTVNMLSSIDTIDLSIGGIVAWNNSDVSFAFVDADIEQLIDISGIINGATVRKAYIGGIIGFNLASLFDSRTDGNIMATVDGSDLYIGGAIGYNNSQGIISVASVLSLSEVHIKHNDSIYDEYSGGFVGYHNDAVIIIEGAEYVSLILASFYNTDTIDDNLPMDYWSPTSFAGNLLDTADMFVNCGAKTSVELQTGTTYPESVLFSMIIEGVEQDIVFDTWSDNTWLIIDSQYPQLI